MQIYLGSIEYDGEEITKKCIEIIIVTVMMTNMIMKVNKEIWARMMEQEWK